MSYAERFIHWLEQPADGRNLGVFRLLFGLFMVYQCYEYYSVGLIDQGFLQPRLLFRYDWFPHLAPLSSPWMHGILLAMAMGALMIASGLWMRIGCALFGAGQAYFLLLEKSYYNNHIYLFVLMCFLLAFTRADHFVSLRPKAGRVRVVQHWEVFFLQAQIVLVYFYGGLAKLNRYWLFEQQPVRTLVESFPQGSLLSGIFNHGLGISLVTYGGLLLDLAAPLLLWHPSFRRWGIWLYVAFNVLNSRLFDDIGIFPFLMLGTITLFYTASDLPLLRRLPGGMPQPAPVCLPANRWVKRILFGYFIVQLLFPFRGFFLPNPLDYTTIGNRFAWRMKVDTRLPEQVRFSVVSPSRGDSIPIDISRLVNPMQIWALSYDPRSVADMGRYLKEEAVRMGMTDAVVRANILIRYNGGPSQYFVDPTEDYGKVTVNPYAPIPWLIPPASARRN